jgi:hypothetical protein
MPVLQRMRFCVSSVRNEQIFLGKFFGKTKQKQKQKKWEKRFFSCGETRRL